jgi:hypothetical protein
MRPLRSGQEAVLAWEGGAVECRVVAVAGEYILLRPERLADPDEVPSGPASLTYLEGMVPIGWDGDVQPGAQAGELRFRVVGVADRRGAVRVPVTATVHLSGSEDVRAGQVMDLSAGGLRFRHGGRLGLGQELRLVCALPGGIVIDADAVVRAGGSGVTSVAFTRLYGVDRDTLARWAVSVLRASLAPAAAQ